jgi:DnaJ-class molecular chaperone
MLNKLYVCSVCHGSGKQHELREISLEELEMIEQPCSCCIAKGWTPTVTLRKQGEDPVVEMNRQENK